MDTIRISDIQYLHQLQNEIYDATKQELNVSLVALDNGKIFNSCLWKQKIYEKIIYDVVDLEIDIDNIIK